MMFTAATAAAAVGALLGSAALTAAGTAAALGVLAAHPTLRRPGVPRRTLHAALLFLALATVAEVTGWQPLPPGDLIAAVTDPARQQAQFLRRLTATTCLILACACRATALRKLPPQSRRHFGQAAPATSPLTLAVLIFGAALTSGLTALLGSPTNTTIAILLVIAGTTWLTHHEIRRHGIATLTVIGATLLTTVAGIAADITWRSRPELREPTTTTTTTVGTGTVGTAPIDGSTDVIGIAVAVETGPDITSALLVTVLLLGAALTVLTCASLSTPHDA